MSNQEILQQHNTRLTTNNEDLSSILDKINKLPEKSEAEVKLQEKSVIPTTEEQIVIADEGYTGLNKVIVEKITGATIEIIPSLDNQTFEGVFEKVDVKAIQTEELNVLPSTEQQNFEGIYTSVTVAGDENLKPENIKQGATIFGVEGNATGGWDTTQIRRCQYMFYNNKEMIDAPYFDTSNVEIMNNMFEGCENLKTVVNYNLSKVTSTSYMFRTCTNLEIVATLDTKNVIDMSYMFSNCRNEKLVIPLLNCEKVNRINGVFSMSYSLKNVLGFKDLGKGYTSKSNNYSNYTLDLSDCNNLTHDSLMNIINNLYDLNLTYDVANGGTLYTQKLILGSTNMAKLTSEEIAIATNKRLVSFLERRFNMQFFNHTKPKMIVADKGKHIRSKDDVYVAEHYDEEGNLVSEHIPHYSTTIFVPDSFTEEQMNELYVEEEI